MEKIKDFLCKRFDGEMVVFVLIILSCLTVASIGVQSLLVWVDELFSSTEYKSMRLNVVVGMLLVLPIIAGTGLKCNHEGNGNIMFSMFAIIGIYVCVVLWFNWFLLIGCIALLCLNLVHLFKINGDPFWVFGVVGIYLLYCIGAYFAMIFHGLEPAIDLYGMIVLSLVTLGIWFRPMFE